MFSSVTKPEKKDTVVWPSFVAPFQLRLLRRSNYNRKKIDSLLQPEKKSSSRLSGRCAIDNTTRNKKVLVVCLEGVQSLLRPGKKVLVICLAGERLLLFLPRVRFTQNHPIFTRNWMYQIWIKRICISFSSNWSNTFWTFNLY